MSRTIYEQFDAAFSRVSAFTIHRDGRFIGRIAFKYPSDGASRLQCFAQVWGGPMTRAAVGGYGYDKATAAAYRAVQALTEETDDTYALKAALATDGGERWMRQLEAGGLTVCQAIDG